MMLFVTRAPTTPDRAVDPGRRHTVVASPVGPLTLIADGDALAGVHFSPTSHPPRALGRRAGPDDALLGRVAEQLAEYFTGERTEFSVPLAPSGGELHARVWRRLRTIPYGELITYGTIAGELGDPSLAQAVGQAVGRNPIAVIIPCHRVVGANGAMTGFAGGVERKRYLLELERRDTLLPPEPPG